MAIYHWKTDGSLSKNSADLAEPKTATTLQPNHPDASESSSHQTPSVVQNSAPSRDPWHKRLRIPSRLFGASVFATRLPFALADAGDDFSNNLFSDLAPILALFGEQVAKQYMSQSMSWVEDIIFAMAPLGIITAMTGAIRVGGARWMKAVIGRAREGNGVVEAELMSSTSSDVCELWNGDGVVRVLGSAQVIELFYIDSTLPDRMDSHGRSDRDILLQPLNTRNQEPIEIYDFESAVKSRVLESKQSNRDQPIVPSPENGNSRKPAPNIALNISGQRISGFEFRAVALIGTSLQMGVIVFAGLSVIWPPWKGEFTKGGKLVLPYAFPLMAVGTVALVVGMFLCAHIIERSTAEQTWAIQQNQMRVAWLQRGGIVNDQQFDSYLIKRTAPPRIPGITRWRLSARWARLWAAIWTKLRGKLWATTLRMTLLATLQVTFKRFSKLCSTLLRWPDVDNWGRIMTSRKEIQPQQASLTAVAISLSLLGFVAQFVGLRGLNWWVTIAQLLAIAIMTVLRAVVRRNLVHDVKPERIESGYELDKVARQIKGCTYWSVVTWEFHCGINWNISSDGQRLGNMVVDARCRLGALSRWGSQWQKIVDSTCEAIEAVMNFLCNNEDVILTDLSHMFEWKLIIEVAAGEVATGVHAGRTTLQIVQLNLSREWLSDGRGWGDWKADKSRIEAVLGLWMLHFRDPKTENQQQLPEERTYRIFDIDTPPKRKTYEQWVRRQAQVVMIDSVETHYCIGKPSIGQLPSLPSTNNSKSLAVISESPLENICGQMILSEFISNVAEGALESIGGKVRVRGGTRGVKASFGLRNTVLDELADKVQQTGLATVEDAFLSIVPPLGNAGKLPPYGLGGTELFSDTEKEITTYLEGGRFEQAEPLLLWLLDVAESSAGRYEADGKWSDACRVYFHLCSICNHIKGGEDYADKAEEEMGLHCERMLINNQDPLGIVRVVLGNKKEEEIWKERLEKWECRMVKVEKDPGDILSSDQTRKGRLSDALVITRVMVAHVFIRYERRFHRFTGEDAVDSVIYPRPCSSSETAAG